MSNLNELPDRAALFSRERRENRISRFFAEAECVPFGAFANEAVLARADRKHALMALADHSGAPAPRTERSALAA